MTQPVTIAMIEDDEGHARLIEKNLRRSGVQNTIVPLADGVSAVAFLFGEDGSGLINKRRPLLILLDLNLPDMSGIDILKRLKEDEHRGIMEAALARDADRAVALLTAHFNKTAELVRAVIRQGAKSN